MTAATRGTSTPDAVATTTLRGPTEVAGFGPALVLVATASGVDVPLVAAVTLLRRFSRHRHDYQATGLASALYIKTAVDFLGGGLHVKNMKSQLK